MLKNSIFHVDRIVHVIWVVLLLATLSTWILSGTEISMSPRAINSLVIGIAFVKLWLVGEYFMELRWAPIALRAAFGAYTMVTFTAVLAIFLFPVIFN